MATITDIISLIVTLSILGGVVAAALYIVKSFSEWTTTTKEKLKSQGYDISEGGLAVHTKKRMDREDYIDATQRNFVKALGAASYGTKEHKKEATSIFTVRIVFTRSDVLLANLNSRNDNIIS
ncbi:hypothetical protein M422DRAFT_256880 [Sphaerobolus stellatus SS14]|uniref:Uncharacterized protein n=1 Tax=Sphaerobolus stellatus (strain SS14) TaxID=990650 RepID=A0A0C9UAZ5_SPHS4|nr:hypothetical protein M422DRAFT_256880 [Sphaerobolus stellatus SS14]